ncbi:Stk1 family PASTA domain-containing Ser/Thr kinase [Streptomyces sp. NPDC002889]|uniref:Stk1 family PASTA domain-containing Ser/Thr kinase n=1 Tax=Streptomyces sp. NPDC002889 TaxID=3364669 RepID=UPI003682964D
MSVGDSGQAYTGVPIRAVGQGRYVLQAPLGEGGMASVHRAHDSVLGRTVAVKTLHSDLARDPSFRERFRREAQAVAGLSHANIVAVHDSGEDAGEAGVVQYIVMEYVSGRSLRELIRDGAGSDGAIPLDTALKMTAAVLDALACSHGRGLIHRDIKPANVMVTDDGTVKVMDFGIARALQSDATSMTRTGTVLGTPQYLSPEQALGKPADARSDLYSVGCMLFELATGTLPFDGESTMSVLYQHVQNPPPIPSSVDPSLPPAVDTVVARALSKDPDQRYPSAQAMAEALRAIAAGETPTRQMPPHEPPTRQMPPHVPPTLTAGAITVTVGGQHPARLRPAPRTHGIRTVHIRLAVAVVVAMAFAAFYAVQSLVSGTSYTPDPRATGAFILCDPVPSWDDEFSPPSFTGMSPAEAKTCAKIAGLKLEQKTTRGKKYDKDTVVRQEPSTQSVESGSTVTVWVSTGGDPRAKGDLENCEVEEIHGKVSNPWFKGRSPAKARVCADIAQLKLREAGTIQDAQTPAGQVAKQEPGSEQIPAGSTVTIWISTGGDPRATGKLSRCDTYATSDQPYPPSLEHMTITDARACAKIARVKLEEHTVPDELWPAGDVVEQEPGSGTQIDPGSTVKVWISSGRP